jgi:hypothetical protein
MQIEPLALAAATHDELENSHLNVKYLTVTTRSCGIPPPMLPRLRLC